MASVNIEFSAFADPRFKILGKLIGTNHFDAIGRCAAIWMYCIERNSEYLASQIIDALAEHDGFYLHMQDAGVADAVNMHGQIRIKGCAGRINYLAECRLRQKVATEAARLARLTPKLEPMQEPKSEPPLVSTSTSSSTSASASTSASVLKNKNAGIRKTYSQEFEELWILYECKGTKCRSEEEWKKLVLSSEEKETLKTAISNYKMQKPDKTYRKDFERFLKTDWREFANQPIIPQFPQFVPLTKVEVVQEKNRAIRESYQKKLKEGAL